MLEGWDGAGRHQHQIDLAITPKMIHCTFAVLKLSGQQQVLLQAKPERRSSIGLQSLLIRPIEQLSFPMRSTLNKACLTQRGSLTNFEASSHSLSIGYSKSLPRMISRFPSACHSFPSYSLASFISGTVTSLI